MKNLKKKWILEILFHLNLNVMTYKEIKLQVAEISDKVLSDRLHLLLNLDLIFKTKKDGRSSYYQLSERGMEINKILYNLSMFGLAILDKNSFNSGDLREEIANFYSIKSTDKVATVIQNSPNVGIAN